MTRGTRTRLVLFAVLSAVGIVYVAASYLGLVDAVLGRNRTMYLDLPQSGGAYVGSEVDYRGVKVGKVTGMTLTREGVRLELTVDHTAKIPEKSAIAVNNLTAIGEQYVNFSPDSDEAPYAGNGHVFKGSKADLPIGTDDLLTTLDAFVNSVNPEDLRTSVKELGTMFANNSDSIGTIIKQGSSFLNAAKAHQSQTIGLLKSGEPVLDTQVAHKDDLRDFSSGLAKLTGALKDSDNNIQSIIDTGGIREADALVNDIRAVLPAFLKNAIPVTQIVHDRRDALEQTLVTFPPVVSTGFTGTPDEDGQTGDGTYYGHLNMQFDYTVSPCSGNNYLPPKQWPDANDPNYVQKNPPPQYDPYPYPARCEDPRAQRGYTGSDGILQRGTNYVPPVSSSGSSGRTTLGAQTSTSATTKKTPTPKSVLNTTAWVDMLLGPGN